MLNGKNGGGKKKKRNKEEKECEKNMCSLKSIERFST